MTSILLASTISLLIALFGTPVAIRSLRARGIGQFIREDGPHAHFAKGGTPTMGGLVIIGAALAGYAASHLRPGSGMQPFSGSGLLAMGTIVALSFLGFADDYIKIHRRRSLGLNKTAKIVAQVAIALVFAWFATRYTQADRHISFVRPIAIQLGIALFAVWVFFIISGASNGVNLADGLDGLACGSGVMVMGAYVIIAFWQFRHVCGEIAQRVCYVAPHSLDLALVAASLLGAGLGFLWWNAAPARIFMGDTGSLALGGAMGVLAILTNTQMLLVVLGGLYVIEAMSVILQVISFRLFHRRVFLMAPVHHHFELLGWPEFTVIVRFWILAGLAIAFGLGLFYADFISRGGIG